MKYSSVIVQYTQCCLVVMADRKKKVKQNVSSRLLSKPNRLVELVLQLLLEQDSCWSIRSETLLNCPVRVIIKQSSSLSVVLFRLPLWVLMHYMNLTTVYAYFGCTGVN